jgi:hypothetical protein
MKMYSYKIESVNLRTQSRSSHGSWYDEQLIPDGDRGQQLWAHARPGRPAVLWVHHEDDAEAEPLHIVGYGSDALSLSGMIGSHISWGRV